MSSNQILVRIVRSMQTVLRIVVAPVSIKSMSFVVAADISVILSAEELDKLYNKVYGKDAQEYKCDFSRLLIVDRRSSYQIAHQYSCRSCGIGNIRHSNFNIGLVGLVGEN